MTGSPLARLAVLTPSIGLVSETFIRNHVEDLLPGRTVVVAKRSPQSDGAWRFDGPTLLVEGRRVGLPARAARRLRAAIVDPGSAFRPATRADRVAFGRFVAEHGVAAVLAEYLHEWLSFVPTCADLGVPLWAHAHGVDISRVLRDRRWRRAYGVLSDAAGIIAMSETARARLVAACGLRREHIHVVPYGVRVPPAFASRPDRPFVSVVLVGRLVGKKAPLLSLEAFRQARAVEPRLRLDIVGDGPLAGDVRDAISRAGLAPAVRLHGALANDVTLRLVDEADIFLQHSITDPATGDEEGLPVAILEAMAHGAVVLATRHAGIPEAVTTGQNGVLVEEGDVAGMAAELVALGADRDLRQQLARRAHATASERFSWDRERAELRRLLALDGARTDG